MKDFDTKKFLGLLVKIVCILGLAYVLFKLCYLTIKSYNPLDNPSDIIKNITSIFTCLTASISLLLTIKLKSDSHKEKRLDKKNEINYFWFKALIADKFIERIFDFFNSCNSLTDKLRETNESNVKLNWAHDTYSKRIKANVVVPFTKEYTRLQQELVLSAEIIDDNLAESIQAAFQNFQDEFLKYTESTNPDYNKCKLMIADSQKNIISILKVYNNNIYD